MKAGDLVTLSAYGKARHYNAHVLNNESGSNVGLIVEVKANRNYPYLVKWSKVPSRDAIGAARPRSWWVQPDPWHSRMELKYATR